MPLRTVESLSADERRRLAESLGCTEPELDARLELVGAAALSEYLDMFLGRTRFSKASDYREYRLLQLINAGVFEVPSNQAVADLFNIELTEAARLVARVYTIYRHELKPGRDPLLKQTLSSAEVDPNNDARFFLTIGSRAIADALNDLLLRSGGLSKLRLVAGSQTRYAIDRASLAALVDTLKANKPAGL